MKRIMNYSLIAGATTLMLALSSCSNLDLNPLSEGSSESWYSSEAEIEMSLKDLYRQDFWHKDSDSWTDDWVYRETVTEISGGTMNGESAIASKLWTNAYKAIARANTLLENMEKAAGFGVSQAKIEQYTAEALFVRAARYADLVTRFGDVPHITKTISLDEAFQTVRTDKNVIIAQIYKEFDQAAEKLPVSYGKASARASKGAAYALKARFALYMGDWAKAAEAAKKCMDLNQYSLHPSYGNLFMVSTRNSKESIFVLPRSIEFNVKVYYQDIPPRNAGGYGAYTPSWDLFCAYLDNQGKPIDESTVFNPREPFKNRDPRCTASIVEFLTEHCGFIYDPNPYTAKVKNLNTGREQTNNDSKAGSQYASYNGLLWKKGVDVTWTQNSFYVDPDNVIIRLADVLLIYAEAKIELNQIDQSVLDAMNSVRARAYGVTKEQVAKYPEIITLDQTELRKTLRVERRMEFAWEGLRYMDIIRWRLAEKVLNKPNYGLLDIADLKSKVVDKGLWFFPVDKIEIDDDGIAILDPLYAAGLAKRLTIRAFDKNRQYLWPIPAKEILINENLKPNNSGY